MSQPNPQPEPPPGVVVPKGMRYTRTEMLGGYPQHCFIEDKSSPKLVQAESTGYWESYECGCTSPPVPSKNDLLGYCGKHGACSKMIYANRTPLSNDRPATDCGRGSEAVVATPQGTGNGPSGSPHRNCESSPASPGHCSPLATPAPEQSARETPITELPDGSGCCTATIMSEEEAMALPRSERPLCFRISGEVYHAIFEAVGHASMCWNPRPSTAVFDATEAEKCAVNLCFTVAKDFDALHDRIDLAEARVSELQIKLTRALDERDHALRDRWKHESTETRVRELEADLAGTRATESAAVRNINELLAEMERRHVEYSKALNKRVDVENALLEVAAGKRDMLTREECRELAYKLGKS